MFAKSIQLFDHRIDCLHLLVDPRVTHVRNMDEQIRFAYFFKRRLKGFDQSMGKFSQETHRIGEQDSLFIRQNEATRGRIERGKKLILCHNVGPGEKI